MADFPPGYDPIQANYVSPQQQAGGALLATGALLAIGVIVVFVAEALDAAAIARLEAIMDASPYQLESSSVYATTLEEAQAAQAAADAATAAGQQIPQEVANTLTSYAIAGGDLSALDAGALMAFSAYDVGWAGGSLDHDANTFTVNIGVVYGWNPDGAGGAGEWVALNLE